MKFIKKEILKYIYSSGYILKKKDYLDKFQSIPSIDIEQKKIISKASKYSMTGKIRQHALINLLNYIFKKKVKGDLVECCTWLGGNLIIFDMLKKKYKSKKSIFGYDTFYGMPKPIYKDKDNQGKDFSNTYEDINKRYYSSKRFNLMKVKQILKKNKVDLKKTKLIPGRIEQTLKIKKNQPKQISLIRLDTDWYQSTKSSLDKLFPLLSKGGILIIDDYGWNAGCKNATDEYFKKQKDKISFFRIDHEAVFLIK